MSKTIRSYREQNTGRIILQSVGADEAVPNSALFIAGGTASYPVTTSTADANFIELRLANSATSGDNRGIYNRLYLTGAGGGGESLRSFTSVKNVAAGTAHGAHISLGFEATGRITGLGAGIRGTLHVPNNATFGGTVCALQAEIYHDGASSTLAGTTEHSVLRLVNDGDSTGQATHLNWLSLVGANANSVKTGTVGGTAKGIRIVIDGVAHYITIGTSCS